MSLLHHPSFKSQFRSIATIGIASLIVGAAVGHADTLTLGTGVSRTWDRVTSPAASPAITLSLFNDTNNPAGIIQAYTLGMRLQPVGNATGTLAIGTVSNPTVNPIFSSIVTPPTVNVQSGFTSIAIENSTLNLAPVPQAGKNAIDFTLVSSDALGTFNIVIDGTLSRSGWNDLDNEYAFGNANNTTLTVGQINVVPEPGTIGTTVIAVVVAGLAAIRRRVRRNARLACR
jgi:hypothetical protein